MSVEATNWAWDQIQERHARNVGLTPTETTALLRIAWRIKPSQVYLEMGYEDLCEDCGASRSSMNRAVKGLIKAALVSVTRRAGSSRSRFILNIGVQGERVDEVACEKQDAAASNVSDWNDAKCDVPDPNASTCYVQSVNLEPSTCQFDTFNVSDWNHTKTPKTPRKTEDIESSPERRRSIVSIYQADFTEWWCEYPRRDSKLAAETAYAKARKGGASAAELIDGLRQFRWPSDPQYIPHASTWLNRKRWQDEPTDTRSSAIKPTAASWMLQEMKGVAR